MLLVTAVSSLTEKRFFATTTKKTKQRRFYHFVTTYDPATLDLKKILMKHWHIIQQQPKLEKMFNQPLIISYRKEKSLKDVLVHARIPSILHQSENQ